MVFVSIAGYILVLLTLITGGFGFQVAGLRISSHNLFRPFAIATLSMAIAVAVSDERARQLAALWQRIERNAKWLAVCAAIFTFVVGVRYGTFTAGGSDSYGYVSEAGLWLKGSLITPEPLAKEAPWPDAEWAFAPLGYKPGPTPATIVPTYAPGYPLAMAIFIKAAGQTAAFFVVPFLGALAVWWTFVIGKKIADPMTGAISAILLMASPIFLFQLVVPMSDVPVTAWWVLSTALALEPSSPLLSGLAASAALMTRPNLFPLAGVVAAYFLLSQPRTGWRRALVFLAGTVPGVVAIAALNAALYGSATRSGYGTLSENFALERAGANLARYPRWLLETQTPFICLALAAPWLVKRERRLAAWFLLAMFGMLFACYILYLSFDGWLYLRFLLPAIPLLLVLSSAVAYTLLGRIKLVSKPVWIVALVGALAVWTWDTAVDRGSFMQKPGEQHFVQTGNFVRRALPADAVLLTMMDSGSVRHYSGKLTVRWDAIPPESLDKALMFLREKNLHPYIVIQDWERDQFRERFGDHSAIGKLDWPPMAGGQATGGTNIYDPSSREP